MAGEWIARNQFDSTEQSTWKQARHRPAMRSAEKTAPEPTQGQWHDRHRIAFQDARDAGFEFVYLAGFGDFQRISLS